MNSKKLVLSAAALALVACGLSQNGNSDLARKRAFERAKPQPAVAERVKPSFRSPGLDVHKEEFYSSEHSLCSDFRGKWLLLPFESDDGSAVFDINGHQYKIFVGADRDFNPLLAVKVLDSGTYFTLFTSVVWDGRNEVPLCWYPRDYGKERSDLVLCQTVQICSIFDTTWRRVDDFPFIRDAFILEEGRILLSVLEEEVPIKKEGGLVGNWVFAYAYIDDTFTSPLRYWRYGSPYLVDPILGFFIRTTVYPWVEKLLITGSWSLFTHSSFTFLPNPAGPFFKIPTLDCQLVEGKNALPNPSIGRIMIPSTLETVFLTDFMDEIELNRWKTFYTYGFYTSPWSLPVNSSYKARIYLSDTYDEEILRRPFYRLRVDDQGYHIECKRDFPLSETPGETYYSNGAKIVFRRSVLHWEVKIFYNDEEIHVEEGEVVTPGIIRLEGFEYGDFYIPGPEIYVHHRDRFYDYLAEGKAPPEGDYRTVGRSFFLLPIGYLREYSPMKIYFRAKRGIFDGAPVDPDYWVTDKNIGFLNQVLRRSP